MLIMREIKFRAWNKKLKEMLPHGRFLPLSFNWGNSTFEINCSRDYILMQYTGLKDKNGKEIYEEDILKGINGPVFLVMWSQEDATWERVIIAGDFFNGPWQGIHLPLASMSDEIDPEEDFEIIGNIHENLELLNK